MSHAASSTEEAYYGVVLLSPLLFCNDTAVVKENCSLNFNFALYGAVDISARSRTSHIKKINKYIPNLVLLAYLCTSNIGGCVDSTVRL